MAHTASASSLPTVETCVHLLLLSVLSYTLWRVYSRPRPRPALLSVAILVLGDIGRSPRMMYHAESFADHEYETYLVGYGGSKPIPSLLTNPRVHLIYLTEPPHYLQRIPFILAAPLKVVRQVVNIVFALAVEIPHPPEFILVQNPPSIPTLALVWLVSRLRGCKVIIDWHNLGYSILALKLGNSHPFVRFSKWFESYFGRTAYAHLFVTEAMREHLVHEWGLQGQQVVLHDRPPARFRRAEPSETHELFRRLLPSLASSPSGLTGFLPASNPPYSTPFTHVPTSSGALHIDYETDPFPQSISMPVMRSDRTALLVSSTSWTPDEDFGMLLEALKAYEKRGRQCEGKNNAEQLPKILVIVTGKGPLREQYMREVGQLQEGHGGGKDGENGPWRFVRCVSLWLEADDYPLLLGSSDLGISLHSSSSGRDLPMKVVDMFGCHLPVCALDFPCLNELVQDGVNGWVFRDADELADHLENLLRGFPAAPELNALRTSFERSMADWGTWTENWNRQMGRLVDHPAGG